MGSLQNLRPEKSKSDLLYKRKSTRLNKEKNSANEEFTTASGSRDEKVLSIKSSDDKKMVVLLGKESGSFIKNKLYLEFKSLRWR